MFVTHSLGWKAKISYDDNVFVRLPHEFQGHGDQFPEQTSWKIDSSKKSD